MTPTAPIRLQAEYHSFDRYSPAEASVTPIPIAFPITSMRRFDEAFRREGLAGTRRNARLRPNSRPHTDHTPQRLHKTPDFLAEAMKTAKPDTILTHAGCNPGTNHGIVNPPVYHASTVLFPTVEALEDAGHSFDGVRYGRIGTPTSQAFETAVAELEGGYKAVATPSGLAAITTALLAFVSAGDHILVSDSVYGPNRLFCSDMLKRMGVEAEFYDPLIGAGIGRLMRPNTRVVFVESPGSLTFEIQDVPAIAAAARDAGAIVMIDNTWATPLFFRPFDHGVDLSIHAATKYMVGHSDAMLGV